MALALTVDKIDTIPEAQRALYVEKEGKFHLDVDGLPDVSGLKSALAAERAGRAELDKQAKAWAKLGKTPEEIDALVAAEQAKAEEALKKAGKFDDILAQKLGAQAKEYDTKLTTATGERDSALGLAKKAIVDTRLSGALTKAKATAEGLDLLTERLGKRVKLDFTEGKEAITILAVDGTDMIGSDKNGAANFDDLVKEAVKQYPSLFEGTGAGGSGKDPKDRKGGDKTMSRKDWDAQPFKHAEWSKAGIRPVD